jgi:uncharacterized protein DUF4430
MARKLSERTQAIVFLVVLGTAIAGLYGWAQASQPHAVATTSVTGVSLIVEGVNWTIRYGPVTTTNNTAFGILMEAAAHLHFAVVSQHYSFPDGVFVLAINGSTNVPGGLGWQYWVSGVYGDRASDLFPLHTGDTVLWRYTTDQEAAG